ncbi:MAG TPA: thiamine pyrophosphate-requiring protein [Chloroflexota bacterium]|nr:thiamine pyrophosphate-requiring protein [Chloroflexota bacterium]
MDANRAIARILQAEGTEFLFAYPMNPLIEACAEVGIRPIMCRTEKTLVNAADGYCRATNARKPAVVTVQSGAGIENTFGGVAQAYADSIPLLLLPGGEDQQRHHTPTGFDPLPPYAHVTKWAARINAPSRVPELMRRALTLLRTGAPGPVLLEIPRDVGAAEVPGTDGANGTLDHTPVRRTRGAGDPADVAEAVKLLLGARHPLIHAGHGTLWAEAWDELRELAELTSSPVMTTMAAKGVFPEDHPLAAGTGGLTLHGTAAHFLKDADVILGVGCSFSTGSFTTPIPAGKTLIQVTTADRDLAKGYPVALAILGDAKLVLRQLIDEVKRQAGKDLSRNGNGVANTVRSTRDAYLREWMPRLTSDESPISPYRVIWELSQALDKQRSIVTHDSGNPRDQTLTFYEALAPRGYIGWGKSTQLGTGYGIALGAKLAHPDKTVVNVMGDLAFGTAGMEVETAVRERIPIMTVLLNNGRMGGYSKYMPVAAERYRINLLSGSYAQVAAGLGAYSERVETPGDVGAALQRGIKATRDGRPVVLEFLTKEDPVYPTAASLLK